MQTAQAQTKQEMLLKCFATFNVGHVPAPIL